MLIVVIADITVSILFSLLLLLTIIPNHLSYAQIDVSGATNLKPEEKQSALSSDDRLTSNITRSQPLPERTTNDTQILMDALEPILKPVHENSLKNPDNAYLVILTDADTTWQASIMDSGNDFTTMDGQGRRTLDFECVPGSFSTYSVSVQKQTESGAIFLALWQNGYYIDSGATTAQYGIVSLSGECNTQD